MFHKKEVTLKDGAYIVSDAHYSHKNPELLEFLKDIQAKKYTPSQLIFMGDIFDTLFGLIPRTYIANQELITIINDISKKIEIVYLEGNHDFNLKSIFPNCKIFTIQNQPVLCQNKDKIICLAHGDFIAPLGYKIYTSLIRNPFVLFVLNILNRIFSNFILNFVAKHLLKKDDCKKIKNFKIMVENRLQNKYLCNYFIEGHFHQNEFIKFNNFNYKNLAAFACNQRYFIVELSKEELLVEKIFSKGK